MSEYLRLKLSSTKPEILASGSTFNKSTKLEILKIIGGEVHFDAHKNEMYDEILGLSKEYPDEKFFITYRDYDYYSSYEYSGVFSNGTYHKTTIQPLYLFQTKGKVDVDRELVDEFVDKILKYLDEKKYKKDDTDPMIHYQVPDVEELCNGLKTSVKFIWETEEHRFIGENIYCRVIEISYENKDKENLKRLRNENANLRNQLECQGDFNDLPF